MNTIKLYAVHNGYEIIGYASNFDEIKNVCENYCKKQSAEKIGYSCKRVLKGFDNYGEDEYTLIYQYSTLYLEMFHATKKVEL